MAAMDADGLAYESERPVLAFGLAGNPAGSEADERCNIRILSRIPKTCYSTAVGEPRAVVSAAGALLLATPQAPRTISSARPQVRHGLDLSPRPRAHPAAPARRLVLRLVRRSEAPRRRRVRHLLMRSTHGAVSKLFLSPKLNSKPRAPRNSVNSRSGR